MGAEGSRAAKLRCVSTDQVAAIGAFLSGAGSVIAARFYIKRARKEYDEECNKRIKMLREGIRIGEHHTETDLAARRRRRAGG